MKTKIDELEKPLAALAELAASRIPGERGMEPVAIQFSSTEAATLPRVPTTFSRMLQTQKGRLIVITRAINGAVFATKAIAQAGFAGRATSPKKAKASKKNGRKGGRPAPGEGR